MTFPPVGNSSLSGCAACFRWFNSTSAFDLHRNHFNCMEPSSIGLWLATDGLWSLGERDLEAESERHKKSGERLAASRLRRTS